MEPALPALVSDAEPGSPVSLPDGALPDASASLLRQADPRLAALPPHLEPLRVLGQGGSSVVYEALHRRLKVKVALKLLTIQGPHADQAQKRMLREAELYALLDDPRIPRVYDVNELPDGTPYVVMEMVPGQSLEELLAARGALPPPLALAITRDLLLVLASVHERGVLHRDVKPANVILTLSGTGAWPSELRLVDFGIAKANRGIGEEAVTLRGALVGTPHYMAPERLAGHPADASTDVYAVGIMLYEMLAGRVPFTGETLPALMAAVMRSDPEPVNQRNGALSPELAALVMKAMARDPDERFGSARAMLEALDALAPSKESEDAVQALSSVGPLPRRARSGKFWFVTALWSTLLVVAGFLSADRLLELRDEQQHSAQRPAALEQPARAAVVTSMPAAPWPVVDGAIVPASAVPPALAPHLPEEREERAPRSSKARRKRAHPVVELDETPPPPALEPPLRDDAPRRSGELPTNPY